MSTLGSRAIVMADVLACHDKPQTASWLEAVVQLCHHVLWMGEWTGVHPPWDGQLRNAPPLALLACWPLHSRTADLLRAVHVQASCLQPLAAWNRQTRAAEQLECCSCRVCQRGAKVVHRQLWSWPSVEARPVLAWAELNVLPCLAHVRWTHPYRHRRPGAPRMR